MSISSADFGAETMLVGAVLANPSILDKWGAKVRPADFTAQSNQRWWRMIRALWAAGKPVDIPTIAQTFPRQVERLGGVKDLLDAQYYSAVVDVEKVDEHFERLLELSARRNLVQKLTKATEAMKDPAKDFMTVLGEIQAAVMAAAPAKDQQQELSEWYEELVELKEDPEKAWGIRTGWTDLDKKTLGWHPGHLIIVGARTSMGKSAFANECALRAARTGKSVAIFSLEMSRKELWNRMVANLCRIPLANIKMGQLTNEDMRKITLVMPLIQQIHIDDTRGVTVEQMAGEMRRIKHEHGLDFVIVDYLSEIVEPSQQSDNAGSALYRVTRKLRAVAKELNVPIMALSQIVRGVESRADKRPTLSDLSGSSGIESGADIVILLYRDDYYNPKSEKKNILEVTIAKHRNGPTGVVELYYDPETQRISSLEKGR